MSRKYFQSTLVVYIILMLAVSTIPGHAIPKIELWSFDKILHIIEYFILAFLAINVIKKPTTINIIIIVLLGVLYGGFNEIWQNVVASRSASIYDAIANCIGMIFGSIISVKYLLFARDR